MGRDNNGVRTVHVVVGCTDRKRQRVPAELRMRHLPILPAVTRHREWVSLLETFPTKPYRAAELYSGDQWSVTRSLNEFGTVSGWRPKVWIASAGYGLINIESRIKPYSASFSSGPDSVCPATDRISGAQDWWQLMSKWEGPDASAPRSIVDLVSENPGEPVLLTLSAPYAVALGSDIERAAATATSSRLVILVTSGVANSLQCLIPIDARLSAFLGGSLHSIYARLARWILCESLQHRFQFGQVKSLIEETMARQSPVRSFDRKRLTDDEARAWVAKSLRLEPNASASSLLRNLRDSGLACEQKRFHSLVMQSKDATHG